VRARRVHQQGLVTVLPRRLRLPAVRSLSSSILSRAIRDIHEISPKFVAFKGPLGAGSSHMLPGEIAFSPEFYAPTLKHLGVTCVVRLNDADAYDAGELERPQRGIWHPVTTSSSTTARCRRPGRRWRRWRGASSP
jgi:hypothetical protein